MLPESAIRRVYWYLEGIWAFVGHPGNAVRQTSPPPTEAWGLAFGDDRGLVLDAVDPVCVDPWGGAFQTEQYPFFAD